MLWYGQNATGKTCVFGLNRPSGPIHTKDARFVCCGNSAADISKSHTSKWDPLADEVLEAACCCGNSATDISKPHTFKWDPLADDVLKAA